MGYVDIVRKGCQCPERPKLQALIDAGLIGGTTWECDDCGQLWEAMYVVNPNYDFYWKRRDPVPVNVPARVRVLTSKSVLFWLIWACGAITAAGWDYWIGWPL